MWFVKKAVEAGTKLEAAHKLSGKGQLKLVEYKHRLVKLRSIDYGKWYKKALMEACECRLLMPQRQLKLAFGEEAIRCKLTWQMLDRRIYDLAFGGTVEWFQPPITHGPMESWKYQKMSKSRI